MTTRARLGATLVGASLLLIPAGCTSAGDEFCRVLSAEWSLDGLAEAIRTDDRPAIEAELAALRDLRGVAPASIAEDLDDVVQTTEALVLSVTRADPPTGERPPVDLTRLNDALADVEPAARRISRYAEDNCGIT